MATEPPRSLRFEIDGEWSAAEMALFLGDLNALYVIRFLLENEELRRENLFGPWWPYGGWTPAGPEPFSATELRETASRAWQFPILRVSRVEYGSLGSIDILGIGSIVGHILQFVTRVIEIRSTREDRTLDREAKRIANARAFVALAQEAREAGMDPVELRGLLFRVDAVTEDLLPLIDDGKLRSVRELPKDATPPDSQGR
jgi:hypothetical protein